MEDKKSKEAMCEGDHECGSCHGCGDMGMMGMGHCHSHRPWKILVRVLVLLFVFWLGTQLGEIRAYTHDGFGMMGGYDRYYMMDGGYPNDYQNGVPAARGYKVIPQGVQSSGTVTPPTANQ